MHNRSDCVLAENSRDEIAIGDIAFIQGNIVGQDEAKPGREIVEDNHRPSGIVQGPHGMTADVTRAARYQYRALFV